jgi:hypothetical protein
MVGTLCTGSAESTALDVLAAAVHARTVLVKIQHLRRKSEERKEGG